jgi:DNA ligase-1
VAVSRNLSPFKNINVQRMFGREEFNGLDGELMLGDPCDEDVFRRTQSCTSSHDGIGSNLRLHVFDDFNEPTRDFESRFKFACRRVVGRPQLMRVPHTTIFNSDQLNEYEAGAVGLGYEGIMIRHPQGLYKYGRSTPREGWLLKVKRFEDSEAVIDDAEELQHNQNEKTLIQSRKAKRNHQKAGMVAGGVLGALVVRDIHTGVQFNIGTGFDAAERVELWGQHARGLLVGQVVKYRYFATGSKTKPRFPSFVGFRDKGDMS